MSENAELAICFADICDSTALFEEHGDDRARAIVARVLDAVSEVIEQYNGTVVKTIGDEVMGTFPELISAVSASTKMPRAVEQDEALAALDLEIRVGMCYDTVVREADGDVFGDAVNTASRLVDWARPSQIVTTAATLTPLPDFFETRTRNLGSTMLEGKEEPVEIVELLGEQSGGDDLTVVDPEPEPSGEELRNVLAIWHGGETVTVEQGPFQLGRGTENDLQVADSRVSRTHAVIERSQGGFVITDNSTNGTYVQIGDEDVLFLHRDELRLHGTGHMSLGRHLEEGGAQRLRFECRTPS